MEKKKTNSINTTIRMPRAKHAELKKYCIDRGITLTQFFMECIDQALQEEKEGGK